MSSGQRAGLSPDLLDMAVELMGRSGRRGTVRVQGRSMLPTLREGQVLAVEFSPERVAVGDVLVFRQEDYLVVHRFLFRSRFPDGRPALRTRGDGTPTLDRRLGPDRVVARVVAARTERGWRDFRGLTARTYGRLVAWHDFFWAAAGVAARIGETLLGRAGLKPPLRGWVAGVDRRLLALAHRMLFLPLHRRIEAPSEAESGRAG